MAEPVPIEKVNKELIEQDLCQKCIKREVCRYHPVIHNSIITEVERQGMMLVVVLHCKWFMGEVRWDDD